ncbi:MAG: HAD hydrolase-like protein [Eubacteriales bacterium]
MKESKGCIFDFDDTLVETTVYYDRAKERFAEKMKNFGFPVGEALGVLNQFDISNVLKCGGFRKDCFPNALVQTYEHFCKINQKAVSETTRSWMADLGWWVFKQPTELIAGATEVLLRLGREMPLILATKGDPEIQTLRLEESGLKQYFKAVYIVPDKTDREYAGIASENGLVPEMSWIIGNSMKGDINPGLKSGFNCIHVFHHNTWDFEEEEPVGEYLAVRSITEVPEIVLGAGNRWAAGGKQ